MDEDPGHAELLAAVDELAAAMKAKINSRWRRHRGRLEDSPVSFFLGRMDQETNELVRADIEADMGGPVEAVRDEAADVSNFAMFLWIRRRRLAAKPSHSG